VTYLLRLVVAAAVLAATGCSGRGRYFERVLSVDVPDYLHLGEEIRLYFGSANVGPAPGVLTLTNRSTGAMASTAFTVRSGAPFGHKLTAGTLPDIGAARTGIERYSLRATVEIPQDWNGLQSLPAGSQTLETEFAVVTDSEARLPVFSPVPLIGMGPPFGQPDPWLQAEAIGPIEDAALMAATERGGRELVASSSLANAADLAASRTPGISSLAAEVYRYEVRGRFPKQVVADRFSASRDERIVKPSGYKMLVPRIARPMPLDVEVLTD